MDAPAKATRSSTLGAARTLAAGVAAGALAGLLVGGIGGRIAMLVLRLTSDPSLHGRLTDDGFTIGIVSTGTFFLLVATAVLGALGGVAYLLVRPWLPERLRPWLFGALSGAFGSARIVRPGGIDFTLLDPRPLAIAMFVIIPAAGGLLTSVLTERFLREGSAFRSSRAALAVLVLLVPIALGSMGPLGLIALAVTVGVAILLSSRSRLDLARVWRSTPVTWVGRGVLVALGVASAAEFANDATAIL